MKKICIFGHSVGWGAWDLEKGGWINRLWFYANKNIKKYTLIYNLSISGSTTETILTSFQNEAKNRKADILIFETGLNDSAYKNKPDNYLVSPEKFRKNILEIIKKAKKITNNILFIKIINCDESKTMPVLLTNIYYTNKNIEKYNEILEEICKRNKISVIDLKKLDKKQFKDGTHPNKSGHKLIADKVWLKINPLIDLC